jgi:outer membrane protein assembly factor BamD
LRRILFAVTSLALSMVSVSAEAQTPSQPGTPATTQVLSNTAPKTTKTETKKTKKSGKNAAPTTEDTSAAPDKILYDRAQVDIKKGRHEVGRLNLQTLINTYPDSEYLAKAKLAIADSYYKEGGTANLAQAIAGYKDFIVFFPFLPEAPYAQIQVAMTHFKGMEKPDRDRTEARAAEDEFQIFLAKYPKDPLVPKAEQHLREVQEVLAEGDFRIGCYYYLKNDRRAAAGRLLSVTKRYPLYSRSDEALWMLGDVFEKSEKKEIASIYYARIVKEYPLSQRVGDAKAKLVAFNVPVPQADPKALAWMQAEASAQRPKQSLVSKTTALVHTGPQKELSLAARNGAPQLDPEADTTNVADVLAGGGKTALGAGGSSPTGNTAVVEVATPGTGANGGSTVEAGDTAGTPPAATGDASGAAAAPSTDNPANADTTAAPAAGTGTDANAAPAAATSADPKAKPDDSTADPKKESTSKKKKGIKKVIPW